MSSGVPKTGWLMKLRKQTKKKTDFSESSKKREPNTHKRRFYKKCLQEIIRLAYERVHTSKDLPLNGAKNSSRLGKFFESSVCQADTIPNHQNANASQHIQKQNDHSKEEENYFTQISHNTFQQGFPWLYAGGGKVSERHTRITSDRRRRNRNSNASLAKSFG